MMTAEEVIAALDLAPHPEGGWYRETWRAPAAEGHRASGTAIYFLLEAHQSSAWHRVDATEIWHWHHGAPLALSIVTDTPSTLTLGPEIMTGQTPQGIVPPNAWQAAKPLGGWALVSCTVSPGFEFTGFELAPQGWTPHPERSA